MLPEGLKDPHSVSVSVSPETGDIFFWIPETSLDNCLPTTLPSTTTESFATTHLLDNDESFLRPHDPTFDNDATAHLSSTSLSFALTTLPSTTTESFALTTHLPSTTASPWPPLSPAPPPPATPIRHHSLAAAATYLPTARGTCSPSGRTGHPQYQID